MNSIQTAIQRPVTVSMFAVATVLFGLVSLDRLALKLLPDISYPTLTIQTDYEDAAPEEIESLITRPIEEAVGVVSGLTRLTSVSRSGQSEVIVEFDWDTNMDLASLEVREKLDLIRLPRDSGKPVILRFDPSNDPIMRLQLYGDLSMSRLRDLADRELKKVLQSASGVAATRVIGGLEEQIRVEIDEKRLAELGLPITEVTRVLTQENLNQAAGSLYDLEANYLVRMLNRFRSVDEIKDLVIRNQAGRQIVLGDLAQVWRGSKEREIITRINGKQSVEIAIYKEGDANTVRVAEAVKARLGTVEGSLLDPQGIQYQVVFNQADFIESAVRNVLSAAALGGLLAILVLFVFLRDLRSTVAIAFSIPLSILATFALMYQTDVTLNIMSLGGIALGVGMLVDNSIVVLEAVHRHRRAGTQLAVAVFRGAREVGMAVTASTLTTVAVFLPLVFVEGIAGQLFRDQALTITYSLLASLVVALTFLPMFLALSLQAAPSAGRPEGAREEGARLEKTGPISAPGPTARQSLQSLAHFIFVTVATTVVADVRRALFSLGSWILRMLEPFLDAFQNGFESISRVYPRVLHWSLDHKSLLLAVMTALVSLSWLLALRLGGELIPPLAQGEFSFEIRLPEGSPIQETDAVLRQLEARVSGFPEVQTVFSSVGGSNKNQFARELREEHVGQLYVVMKDRRDQPAETAVLGRIRQQLGRVPDAVYTFSRPTLFSFKTPVEVEVYGFDLADLGLAAELIAQDLQDVEGLGDLQTSTQPGNPEIHVRFDRDRLARLGLEGNQISSVLRNKIRGDVASRYREQDRQIDILVRAAESDRQTLASIEGLIINGASTSPPGNDQETSAEPENPSTETPADGGASAIIPIRLGSVASVHMERGPSQIQRIRSQRAAIISANLTGRDLNSVSRDIQLRLDQARARIPPNTSVSLAGQNQELATSYRSLFFALGLAVFLVYLVMASQFESLVHPFVILFTVPLSLVGVAVALSLSATSISVVVFLGVIVLAGIVVNNAIVLVDFTNQLRQQGLARRAALVRAGQVRLRPIVMTTMTTVLGLIPMAIAWGEGAEIRAPMAITVMGGLVFSTFLTLFLIPVFYELLDRRNDSPQPAAGTDLATGQAP